MRKIGQFNLNSKRVVTSLTIDSRYGAVIRNPDAYVPPGARKTALNRLTPSQSSTPSPSGSERSLPKLSSVLPVRANPSPVVSPRASPAMPPVHHNFRQFVTDEKERLAQKKQVIIKNAEKKEQDSRLASLLEFSQNFKVQCSLFRFVPY